MRNKQSLRKVSLGAITLLAAGFLLWAKAADPSRRSETTPLNVDSFVGLPGQTSTLLPDGEALLLGGEGTKGSGALAGIENPGNAQVTFLPTTMLQARAWHSATVLPDGSVVIFGGVGADGHVVKTV